MPLGIDIGARADTLASTERERGVAGPTPDDGHIEIRWARLDGEEVVVKAGSQEQRDRLRREAEVMRRIGSEPTVELAELVEGADHTELVSARFGTLTLAESGLLDPWECGTALLQCCDALERLHTTGWAHGDLEASHVLVDPGAGVRFCSLASACEIDSDDGRTAVASDRDALAGIVTDVLRRPAGFDSRRARRSWRRAAKRAESRLVAARGLRRPEQVREVLEAARLPGSDGSPREPTANSAVGRSRPDPEGPERWKVLALAAVLAVISAAGAWLLSSGRADVDETVEAADVTPVACTDIDGDGTCDDVSIDAQEVVVEGRTYSVGEAGDIARLGDWDCDGRATVALLRPTEGLVFEFDGWAEVEGESMEASYLGDFDGAIDIVPSDACGPVSLEMRDGSTLDTSAPGEGS